VARRVVLIPLICVAFALLRPGLAAVRALGWVTAVLAAVSLVLAVVDPSAARYDLSADLADDKFVGSAGILAGPFGSGNNLGLALAVGLPSVLMLPRRWVRAVAVAVVLVALAWTFSRTSWFAALAAVAVGAAVVLLPGLRRLGAAAVLSGLGLVALVLPWVTSSGTAFSNRGGFWAQGLEVWRERPLTGWGPDYYARVAQSADNLGGFAFHAHNQGVQLLVTGGVLLFAVVVAAFVWAGVRAVREAALGRPWAAMVMTALLVCATFEVPLGVVDRAMFFPFVLVPLCILLTSATPGQRPDGGTGA
jgi:O-antigen ligase